MKNSIKTILRRPTNSSLSPQFASSNAVSSAKAIISQTAGILKRPWRRIRRADFEKETVFVLARRNYKVHIDIGQDPSVMTRYAAILDTGAGSSFIKKSAIPLEYLKKMLPVNSDIKVRDANNRPLSMLGKINLHVQIGTKVSLVAFYVVEKLATSIILGCDFCDKNIDAIRPRKRYVELDDGTTVPIVRKPSSRSQFAPPLPEDQVYVPPKGRASTKIRVCRQTIVQPGTQAWVEVTTDRHGLVEVEPNQQMLEAHSCLAGYGVAQVSPGRPFKILIANFGDQPTTLLRNQTVAKAKPHPTSIKESNISHGELLGILKEGTPSGESKTNTYRKRNVDARDAETINKHLADMREAHMGSEESPTTAEDIELDVEEKYHSTIRTMLKKHESMWNGKLGDINVVEHSIDLVPGARPFKSQPYRAGPKTRELEQSEINKQLEAGVIEPAQSAWAAPVLFVPKKDGKLRFCIDYRKLNSMTVKDSYPLPRMDECIDTLGEAKVFTTLDAYSGYWQVNVKKDDRPKTAFVCHAGAYQCVRMPFGLTNAPATFQRALDLVLSKFKWQTCLVYLDDVIIFSKDVESHVKHVDEILSCLKQAGVTLKVKKCKFFTTEVEYLGHIIKPGRLEVDGANTKSLKEALPPTSKTELRSFLGLCNVYRRFIKDFTKTAHPLNQLLKKNSPDKFQLDEEQVESFRQLVDAVCSPPVLALPVSGLPYSVDCDASAYQIGCALFQTHPNGERKPIGYWSRSLIPAEKNYSASERECLAVLWALKTLRPYLMYERFMVYTDHAALRWLLSIQEPSGRLMRWRLRLAEFDFEVAYKKGTINTQADALSRLRTLAETITDDSDEIPSFLSEEHNFTLSDISDEAIEDAIGFIDDEYNDLDEGDLDDSHADELFATLPDVLPSDPTFQPISDEELLTAQLSDSFCSDIRNRLNGGEVLAFAFNEEGLLIRTSETGPQVVIPHVLKAKVLHIHHYARLAGHPGGRKLYQTIRRSMYWPALAVDCYATSRRCSTCARNRIKLRKNVTELQLFPAKAPLESVAIDVLGELIKTARGHEYLLVITDRFTKLTKTVPMKGISAAEVAKHFVNEWVFNYGPPKDLIADNGGCFTAKFFQSVCKILNVHNSFTTTYHPQTNGQTERFNRTIKAMIRSYLADHPRDWDLYTGALTFAYNCQPHSTTALAPFELVLSRTPPPLALEPQPSIERTPAEAKSQWKAWLGKALSEAKGRLERAQARYKKNYDARLRRQSERIKKNDYVYVRVERRDEKEHRHKLAAVAEGPYRVIETKDTTVTIEKDDKSVERLSRSRVVAAPEPRMETEIQESVRPMTDEELNQHDYPAKLKDKRVQPREKNKQTPQDATELTPNRSKRGERNRNVATDTHHEDERSNHDVMDETERRPHAGEGEFVMERIISHLINGDEEHPHAKKGERLYRIRWYGYTSKDDTYEPIQHLPRSKVISYYRRKKAKIPPDIDRTMVG